MTENRGSKTDNGSLLLTSEICPLASDFQESHALYTAIFLFYFSRGKVHK